MALAARGARDLDDGDGVRAIDDTDVATALRRRARRIHVQALAAAVLYGALCAALASS